MSDTKDKEKAEDLVTLRALGTYPMPFPVRRGTIFERPTAEGMGYVARGKAELVKGHTKKTAADEDQSEAKADAGKDRPSRTTRSPE